jgi:hypothetical protein
VERLEEGKLAFEFGESWRVVKWDACAVYLDGIQKLNGELLDGSKIARTEGTKAVDFVGVLGSETLYLCEVKDFRKHHLENQKRQRNELPLEIGLKVRDTLAGLVGAYVKQGGPDWVELCGQALTRRKHQVHVVVWIAEDAVRPRETAGMRAGRYSARLAEMKRSLRWLTSRVWVEDPQEPSLREVTVQNLAGAGQE